MALLNKNQIYTKLRNLGVVASPVMPLVTDIDIPKTRTAAPNLASADFTYTIRYPGAILYSFAATYDNNTQTNYSFLMWVGPTTQNYISGQNEGPANFQPLPTSTLSFGPIPEGIGIFVPGGTQLNFYAFNSNSATVDGQISVSVLLDQLEEEFFEDGT